MTNKYYAGQVVTLIGGDQYFKIEDVSNSNNKTIYTMSVDSVYVGQFEESEIDELVTN